MSTLQSWAQTITIAAVLVAALIYQTRNLDKRIDDFRAEMNHRFEDFREEINHRVDDLQTHMNSRFAAIDRRFDDLKDWIRSEIGRLEARIEHPAVKQ